MSVEISGELMVVILAIPLVLLVAVVTMPRWCIRSLAKHALWRLRDDIVDDTITGELPTDHKAVREIVAMAEWAIRDGRSFDLLHLVVWWRACRNIPEETRRALQQEVTLVGLTDEQAERVKAYRARYVQVAITALMLSSWMGVATVLRFAVPAILRARAEAPETIRVGSAVQRAASAAASETRLGRYSREYVWAKPRDSKFAHAKA